MADATQSVNGRLYICLNVKDLEASCAFYAKLGFAKTGEKMEDGWAVINDGENELHLFQGHISSNMLNFRGGDVFAIAEALKGQGLEMKSDATKESDGSDGAWIKDPDGNDIYFNTSPDERRYDA
ncbi:MAG: VOC family protein [Pseudomonadales bacterium]